MIEKLLATTFKFRVSPAWQWAQRTLLVLFLMWYLVLGLHTELIFLTRLPVVPMQDFRVYMDAFMRAAHGSDPYLITETAEPFLYPLPSLLVIAPFSLIQSEFFRAAVFITINLALLVGILWMIGRRYGYRLSEIWWWFPLAFGFAPVLELLHLGQINLVTSFGIVLMFLYADRWATLSGFGWMLATVTKLSPIAFLAYLFSIKKWSAIGWGIALLAVAFGISFFVFGWSSMAAYPSVAGSLFGRFVGESDSQTLVAVLRSLGLIETGAQSQAQLLLTVYLVTIILASGAITYLSGEQEPFFMVLALGTAVAANRFWYHHYVFVLLPVLIWMAWSRFHPAVVLWSLLGLTMTQVDRGYWTRGLMPHIFVHLTVLGVLGWQLARLWKAQPRWAMRVSAGMAVAMVLIVAGPLRTAADVNSNLAAARLWISQGLRPGTRLAVDVNSPDVDPKRYVVERVESVSAHPPEWYKDNGFEYLIFGYETGGRFCQDPGNNAPPPSRYDAFLSQFVQTTHFTSCLDEIRILKTNTSLLPSHGVASRLGLQGEWLEFVGYDLNAPNLTFYWRSLQLRRLPLTLTVRLLDREDRELSQSSGNLFGTPSPDGRWPSGIVKVPWKVGGPATIDPGIYKLELQVDGGEGIGQIPVLSASLQLISDKVIIGPFRVAPTPPSQAELSDAHPMGVQFADTLKLAGYRLNQKAASPGGNVSISLYWESAAQTDKNYTVFLHLFDVDGKMRAQMDAQPRRGVFPTSLWEPGDQIRDDVALPLPSDLPPGEYRVELGLYEYPSLSRLPAVRADGTRLGDHVLLDDIVRIEGGP